MKEAILYISFLLNDQAVSGTLSLSPDSVRYWDGSNYQKAKTKYFGLNKAHNGIVSVEKDGQLIVMQISNLQVIYSINGKAYHFRRKQLN